MSALVKKCTISDLEAESNLAELIAEYAAECSIEGLPEPRGKLDLYKSIEGTGMMHAYSAHVEGVLVGFAGVISTVNPHYGIVLATTETLFVTKDARCTHAGGRLIACAKQLAREVGSPKLFIIAPVGSVLEAMLDDRKDCLKTNSVYVMDLP